VSTQPLLSPFSARRDPPFPGLSIDTRFVTWVLGFERVVRGSSHIGMGLGTQDLLQRSNRAGVPWLGAQPSDGLLSHPSMGIALRYLDQEPNQIP